MATKKASPKKAAKKSSKAAAGPTIPPPPIPLKCIRACYDQYMICLKKGVDPALCTKRYMRCIQDCFKK